MPFFRRSTEADCKQLAQTLRVEDLAEVIAASGPDVSPEEALRAGLSGECYTCFQDSTILFMYGVHHVPALSEESCGAIWLLAAPEMLNYKIALTRLVPPQLKKFAETYGRLFNVVDSRNEAHIKWIEWTGFQFTGRKFYLADPDVPFLEFVGDF